MAAKDELGVRGERIAERHLVARGFEVLDRNWRCPQGEIDLVFRDGSEVVFVEVKTRTSVAYGHPLEAITATKLGRLRRLAGSWCEAHPGAGAIRIDAVGVIAPRNLPATVEHVQGVF
ncbi:MAG TPA: YraN family protein [Pseudolysinimonas sp.]|nr:YraN family protein [Pseudolysinimonas sp.]